MKVKNSCNNNNDTKKTGIFIKTILQYQFCRFRVKSDKKMERITQILTSEAALKAYNGVRMVELSLKSAVSSSNLAF